MIRNTSLSLDSEECLTLTDWENKSRTLVTSLREGLILHNHLALLGENNNYALQSAFRPSALWSGHVSYITYQIFDWSTGFHLENCSMGGRGMMVTDVTKFHKRHLGSRGMLECMCVCVCVQGFIQDFEFVMGGTSKFGVDMEGVYST